VKGNDIAAIRVFRPNYAGTSAYAPALMEDIKASVRTEHNRRRARKEQRLDRIAELRAYILDQRGHAS
jgi:hypothetical protein